MPRRGTPYEFLLVALGLRVVGASFSRCGRLYVYFLGICYRDNGKGMFGSSYHICTCDVSYFKEKYSRDTTFSELSSQMFNIAQIQKSTSSTTVKHTIQSHRWRAAPLLPNSRGIRFQRGQEPKRCSPQMYGAAPPKCMTRQTPQCVFPALPTVPCPCPSHPSVAQPGMDLSAPRALSSTSPTSFPNMPGSREKWPGTCARTCCRASRAPPNWAPGGRSRGRAASPSSRRPCCGRCRSRRCRSPSPASSCARRRSASAGRASSAARRSDSRR